MFLKFHRVIKYRKGDEKRNEKNKIKWNKILLWKCTGGEWTRTHKTRLIIIVKKMADNETIKNIFFIF